MKLLPIAASAIVISACAQTPTHTASRDQIDASPEVHNLAAQAEAEGKDQVPSFNNIVCERIERTGTRRIQRVCYTVTEADDLERRTQDQFNRLNSRNGCIANSRGAGCGNTQIHANEGPLGEPPQ